MNAENKALKKPVNQSSIQPRRMDFEFSEDLPRYWFDNSQFKTLLLSALSGTFPEGERFFIRSVRHYQKQIKNSLLKEEVKGFIGQEAHHGNEHDAFNELMTSRGIPVNKVDAFVKESIAREEEIFSPERLLARTCALEHFTAMLAEMILEDDSVLEGMDERMKPLWLWHAVEESEHKSVAYDVYQEQVGDYWVRVSEMAMTTVFFTFFNMVHYAQLSREMPEKTDWKSIRKGMGWLLGKKGILRKLAPAYLDYFRADFHPSQKDASALREKGLRKLAKDLNRPELLDALA